MAYSSGQTILVPSRLYWSVWKHTGSDDISLYAGLAVTDYEYQVRIKMSPEVAKEIGRRLIEWAEVTDDRDDVPF